MTMNPDQPHKIEPPSSELLCPSTKWPVYSPKSYLLHHKVIGTYHLKLESHQHEDKMEFSASHTIKEFAKQLFRSRIFIGNYKERCYVEALCGYRGVVVVNNCEKLLKQDLEALRKRILAVPEFKNKWIGITEPETVGAPDMHCLWTDVGDIPFGSYWFQIKSIKLKQNEIFLKLQCLRPLENESIAEKTIKYNSENSSLSNRDVSLEQIKEKVKELKNEILHDVLSVLTYSNIKTALWFTSVFIFTSITVLLNSVQYIGDFSLRLVKELTVLIHTLTPIIIALIDFVTKCVGGFYILLSMLWRGGGNPPSQIIQQHPLKALPMPRGKYYTPGVSQYNKWNPNNSNTHFR